ncbi:MAG: twitch domain-containing radical SAM protein, partial [Bdellovibrionaceae bacterium]|nr:twitch domain-containing radical SAM protein [Pseudobdellovibrionaceae bacterium]
MSKGKVFCAYPYVSLFVANSGKQFPCCYAQNAHSSEIVQAHISKAAHIEDLWNSDYIKKIRQIMKEGQFPAACSNCERTELLLGESYRQRSLEQFQDEIEAVVVAADNTVASPIKHLDLRLGNKCNLACRMCHPMSSNQLIPEWLESTEADDRSEAQDALKTPPWSRAENSMNLLSSPVVDPVYMHLAGGEPSIDKRHEKVLEHLVASGKAKRMTISYNTNLTQMVPALKFKEQFNKILITASIDGVGAINDYIRYPSQWNNIEKNLNCYLLEVESAANFKLEVNITVSAYNILFIAELVRYLAQLSIPIVPVFTIVQDPDWIEISVLPKNLLQRAFLQLSELRDIYSQGRDNALLQERLSGLKEWIRTSRWSEERFLKFCSKTDYFDQKRRMSIFDFLPELKGHWRGSPVHSLER